jgi:NADPH:quinone reductase-like Zn-dependent oxidoreductase
MNEMNAIRVHHSGGPEVLAFEQTPLPAPGGGEALIRVRAAGVGPWDAPVRSRRSGVQQTLPLTPGADIAGVVERIAVVNGASPKPGDAIYGVTNAREPSSLLCPRIKL